MNMTDDPPGREIPRKRAVTLFFAGNNNHGKTGKRLDKDIECFNCHKKGHKKADCWAKGGGKEGQGPKSKLKKEKEELKKEVASTAEEDSVWMAMANNSDDENMANSEFDDFTVLEEELFFKEDEDNNVMDLTTRLKRLLKIVDPSKYPTYPFDNPDYLLDTHNFTDSSDDEQGAMAMKVSSETDGEDKINPYWAKIRVNELRELGSVITLKCLNTDSMPDLIDVSESEVSTDSVIFVLTPPDSCRTTNSEVDDEETKPTLFSDEEMIDLAEDEGEEGLTTFNAAMLVNVEGQKEPKPSCMILERHATCCPTVTTLKTMFQLLLNQLLLLTSVISKP